MAHKMKIPSVGESITEVVIASWLKQDGDMVEVDESIAEIESDKATVELPAEKAGVLKTLIAEGETVKIGEIVCEIDESGASSASSKEETSSASTSEKPKATGKTLEMKIPSVGESITEVTIASWLKQSGDFVEADESLAEIESDKATVELPAETSGILEILVEEGTTVKIGDIVCKIAEATGGAPQKASAAAPTSAATPTSEKTSDVLGGHVSPAARGILAEKGIDASSVKGTGKDGRITKEDAMNAKASTAKKEAKAPSTAPVQVMGRSRETERKKMSPLRKTIAKRLVAAKNTTAMLTTFNEIDMTNIMAMRKKYKEAFAKKYDIGLGFMSLFTKATVAAVQNFPAVNAQLDGEELLYFDYVDMGVAVSTPKGLVVPVVRNAESMKLHEIEKSIKDLALRGRDGKLSINEMQGGTFTITNGGVFGSMLSTPILNAPQSAILGMHNIVQRPIAVDGQVVIAPVMYVALSYDHRVVDGRESVGFLKTIKEMIEDPERLLLEV